MSWSCGACGTANEVAGGACMACGAPPPPPEPVVEAHDLPAVPVVERRAVPEPTETATVAADQGVPSPPPPGDATAWSPQLPSAGAPAPFPGPAPTSGGGRTAVIAAVAVVAIVAVAAIVIVLTRPDPTPTSVTEPDVTTTSWETATTKDSTSTTANPTTTEATTTTTAATTTTTGIVAVSGWLDGTEATSALEAFTAYFTAINAHDFPAARRHLSPGMLAKLDLEDMERDADTTYDDEIVLESFLSGGSGRASAVVSFRSTQETADSPTGETCNRWRIEYSLVWASGGWLIDGAKGVNGAKPYRSC